MALLAFLLEVPVNKDSASRKTCKEPLHLDNLPCNSSFADSGRSFCLSSSRIEPLGHVISRTLSLGLQMPERTTGTAGKSKPTHLTGLRPSSPTTTNHESAMLMEETGQLFHCLANLVVDTSSTIPKEVSLTLFNCLIAMAVEMLANNSTHAHVYQAVMMVLTTRTNGCPIGPVRLFRICAEWVQRNCQGKKSSKIYQKILSVAKLGTRFSSATPKDSR